MYYERCCLFTSVRSANEMAKLYDTVLVFSKRCKSYMVIFHGFVQYCSICREGFFSLIKHLLFEVASVLVSSVVLVLLSAG